MQNTDWLDQQMITNTQFTPKCSLNVRLDHLKLTPPPNTHTRIGTSRVKR